jgi:hypothetical protein
MLTWVMLLLLVYADEVTLSLSGGMDREIILDHGVLIAGYQS